MNEVVVLQSAAVADGNGSQLEVATDELSIQISGTFVADVIMEGTLDGENWISVPDVYTEEFLALHLSTDGDGTGTISAIGDYSGAGDEEFWYGPAAGYEARIARLIQSIEDNAAFDAGYYGGSNAALTEGILFEKQTSAGAKIVDLLGGSVIKNNADWAKQCYDLYQASFGSGNDVQVARWTFSKSGTPVILDGDAGEKMVMTLRDSMATLVDQDFHLQGVLRQKGVKNKPCIVEFDSSPYADIRARIMNYSSGTVTVKAMSRPD